jgi:hypothetical protein
VTLGGGAGFNKESQLLFETLFLMLLEGKLFDTKQDKASKDTYFLIHLIFQSNLGLKNRSFEIEKCHTGVVGSENCQKVSCII